MISSDQSNNIYSQQHLFRNNNPNVRWPRHQFNPSKNEKDTNVDENGERLRSEIFTVDIHSLVPQSTDALQDPLALQQKQLIDDQIKESTSISKLKSISALRVGLIESNVEHFDQYQKYKTKASEAFRNRKIFTIYGGYQRVRRALLNRGWVEKCCPYAYRNLQNINNYALIKNAKSGNDFEVVLLSKMVQRYPANFIWQPRTVTPMNSAVQPYRNRVHRSKSLDFTTKEGLIGCIENAHWNTIEGISEVHVPRFHRLAEQIEVKEFLRDYRTTYCLSLLLYIAEKSDKLPKVDYIKSFNIRGPNRKIAKIKETEKEDAEENNILFNEFGTVPLSEIKFAITRIKNEISAREHADINPEFSLDDNENEEENEEWEGFMISVNRVTKGIEKFRTKDLGLFLNYVMECKKWLNHAQKYWPHLKSDGYRNLWIVKPGYSCRGNGIVIRRNFQEILNYARKRHNLRHVVQKYIEKPLLIHRTKFDIRQYIILSITDGDFTIWMYKDCYLRFSSQEYSLEQLNESIHITNNAIQRKYKNGQRSEELPAHNMWHLCEFQEYLKSINKDGVWEKKIYPKMKQSVVAISLASLETTECIPNTFEMYGCDFMIDLEFNPILIEINSTPDMSHSTIVTAKICPQSLEDVVKVIVDLPRNPKASTGMFEAAYTIPLQKTNQSITNLSVNGRQMKIRDDNNRSKIDPKHKSRKRAGKEQYRPAERIKSYVTFQFANDKNQKHERKKPIEPKHLASPTSKVKLSETETRKKHRESSTSCSRKKSSSDTKKKTKKSKGKIQFQMKNEETKPFRPLGLKSLHSVEDLIKSSKWEKFRKSYMKDSSTDIREPSEQSMNDFMNIFYKNIKQISL